MDCSSSGSSSSSIMWRFRFLRALMALFGPILKIQNGSDNDDDQMNEPDNITDLPEDQEIQDRFNSSDSTSTSQDPPDQWYHETLQPYLKRSFAYNRVVHRGRSQYHKIEIIDSKPFGKVLLLDEKLECAEMDEFVYHEYLVHPALLIHHESPRSVFIMGGGQGCTAREVLKHRNIEKVIMCDIDKDVVRILQFFYTNWDSIGDERLQTVFEDAKGFLLEDVEEKFDVIVGDLGSDPIESVGGPCINLYSKPFYELVLKPKLNPNGIFVTYAGLAGVISHKDFFSPLYNTLKQVFNHVVAYTAHVPSYADTCGWVMASDEAIRLDGEELNKRIEERINGELRYLDGPCIVASTVLNKTLQTSLMNETKVITG